MECFNWYFLYPCNFQTLAHCREQFSQTSSYDIADPEPTSRPHQTTSFRTILLRYWSPNQTNLSESDHQTKPMSVCQTNRPDQTTFHQSTNQLDIFTARPTCRQNANELLLIQVRSIPYGLGQGRLIYRALDEPCKAYYPHTFGLKSLDFYFRL